MSSDVREDLRPSRKDKESDPIFQLKLIQYQAICLPNLKMFYASSHKEPIQTHNQKQTKNNLSIRGIERVTGCDNLVNKPFQVNLRYVERKES